MQETKAYFSHLQLFKNNILSMRTKMKLYKTLLRLIVAHGAEALEFKSADEQHFRVFVYCVRSVFLNIFDVGTTF